MSTVMSLAGQLVRSQKAWGGPTSANIEVTNLCNIDCIMCRRTGWGKGRSVGNMSLEQFGDILDQIPTLRTSVLTGIGEPLINKEFLAMLRLATERGVASSFVTNATLLTRQGSEKLTEMRRLASQIIVSVDSPDPKEFEEIRVRAKFDEVMEGTRALTAAGKGEAGMAPIRINTVVMESTVHRMAQTVRMCADLGVNIVTFTPIMEYRPDVDVWEERHITSAAKLKSNQQEAETLGKELGVLVTTDVVSHPALSPYLGCAAPWDSIAVTYDGYVCPCCMLNDSDEIHFGNLFEEPFTDIWNGEQYRQFRAKFGLKKVPCECKDVQCHVALAILGNSS